MDAAVWKVEATRRFLQDAAYLQVKDRQLEIWAEHFADDPAMGLYNKTSPDDFGTYTFGEFVVWYILVREKATVTLLRIRDSNEDHRSKIERVFDESGEVIQKVSEIAGILGSVKGG